MTRLAHPLHSRLVREDGSVMIEALVSAVLVGIMAVAFFGALNGSERVSGVGKLRAQSASLAQDDQERMRAMPVTALNNLDATDTRSIAGVNFTVASRAVWIADQSKAATCTTNGAAADYLKITSTVSPTTSSPLKPVVITSTVTPAPGSFNGKGSLSVRVVDRNGAGVPGVSASVTGPASATTFTDATGCAFFGYLPTGTTYTVGLSKTGYVDPDGDPTPSVASVTINDQQVATQGFTYDLAAAAKVTFFSRPFKADGTSLGSDMDSSQWGLMVNNGAHVRKLGPGYPTSVLTASPWISAGALSSVDAPLLFPFTSAYAVYAGQDDCAKDNPALNGVADPGLLVVPGKLDHTFDQQLPALNVYGTVVGTKTANLRVRLTHVTAGCASWSIVRQTNAEGLLNDPGLPYGTYDICVDNSPIVGTSNARKATKTALANTSLPGTPVQTLNVNTASPTKAMC